MSASLPLVPRLDEIRSRLAAHSPRVVSREGMARAAVAILLRGPEAAPSILFIERAQRKGDLWSGQMAFPGGRFDASDRDERETAERETAEEVGLDLSVAERLGQIDDLSGRPTSPSGGLVVSAHVYAATEPQELVPNAEVADVFWFPVASLLEPERQVVYSHPAMASTDFPGLRVGDPERHIVWGLTHRFLEIFLETIGHPLPERSA